MGRFEVGFVLVTRHWGPERTLPRWTDVRQMALRAEAIGLDTVWVEDELLWRARTGEPLGFWDGVSMTGAVAAVTSRIKVGSWVLSALHRNPGIIAKTAETLDEISGGRFVFGLGAGHAEPGQARPFGLPEDRTFSRFAEAVQVVVPLMRQGRADSRAPSTPRTTCRSCRRARARTASPSCSRHRGQRACSSPRSTRTSGAASPRTAAISSNSDRESPRSRRPAPRRAGTPRRSAGPPGSTSIRWRPRPTDRRLDRRLDGTGDRPAASPPRRWLHPGRALPCSVHDGGPRGRGAGTGAPPRRRANGTWRLTPAAARPRPPDSPSGVCPVPRSVSADGDLRPSLRSRRRVHTAWVARSGDGRPEPHGYGGVSGGLPQRSGACTPARPGWRQRLRPDRWRRCVVAARVAGRVGRPRAVRPRGTGPDHRLHPWRRDDHDHRW